MNSQSTPSRTPRESLDITRQRNTAGSTPGVLQPLGIYDRFTDAKTAIISLIKNTAWTSKSSKAQKSLLETVSNLANIPENTAEAEEMRAMEDFMKTLEDVRESLKAASTKYGAKDSRKRDKAKKLWANLGGDGGIQVLETCRTNIETAVNRLQIHETLPTVTSTQNVPSSGQDHQVKGESRLSSNLSIAKSTFDMVGAVSDTIPLVGSYIGAAAKLGSMIVEMWQGMDSNKEAAKSLESRMTRLAEDLEYFKSQAKENPKEQPNKRIRNLQLQLKSVGEEIKALNSKGAITKAFLSRDNAGILKEFQEQIKTTEDEIHRLVSFDTNELLNKLYEHTILDGLGGGSYGEHGHRMKDAICLEGTREGILQRITDWVQDASSDRVLWISGMAGRGKSTIATTVAHRWSNRSAWALFHFRRGQAALEKRLVCSLAKQLESRGTPKVTLAILQAIRDNKNIAEERLEKQFEALLVNPLKEYPLGSPPILLIVDALDECKDSDYATTFIDLIAECASSLPRNVKFILTTRPEHLLVKTLRKKEWRTESLEDIDDSEIRCDIGLFIESELSKIKKEENRLPANWPPKDSIQKLAALSEGFFQWARTIVKHVGGGSPYHRLKEVLRDSFKVKGLDGLYRQILSNAFEKAKEASRDKLLHRILAALVVAPYPVSPEVLAYLFSDQEILRDMAHTEAGAFMCHDVLPNIASLLFIPTSTAEPIQLMHTSIRDFLIDVERCGNGLYSVNLPGAHFDLTRDCFRLMKWDREKNICNLSDLSKPNSDPYVQAQVASEVPSGLQYCCRSWAIHFHESDLNGGKRKAITKDLEDFSKEKMLCWLEVMSLIGKVGEAIAMAKQTEQHVVVPNDSDIRLPSLWNDAIRFIMEFLEPISFGALHIYTSALPFCPIDTQLWKYYHCHRLTEVLVGQQQRKWSANLWTRRMNGQVNEVRFSPNGKILALGLGNGTVCFWDIEGGEQLGEPMQCHTKAVNSIAFSPCGERLVSGSEDKTVRLWDAMKREQLGESMHCDSTVIFVAFSPDGKKLASGSADKTVRLWDAEKRKLFGKPMQGHTNGVTSVAFSPDDKMLASGSWDKTVRLWDAEKGELFGKPLCGHTGAVICVAFSPDGKKLASGSADKTVRLWDAEKWEQLGKPIQGHTHWVASVAFSPDGKRLASGSWDKTVRLWDAKKGEQLGEPMQGHTNWVTSVAFSPDGKRLASGSDDKTIQLWDAEKEEQLRQSMPGHTRKVTSVAFSPDGKTLASGSRDKTVCLWDAEKGKPFGEPMQGHTSWVTSVAFSPDGKRLASGSWDKTVQLWDAEKGEPFGKPLRGHTGGVISVAFSADGKKLASGSEDKTVRLWDTEKREPFGKPMCGHTSTVTSVAFSPDGKRLASGSRDETVFLWDAEKGEPFGEPMQGHTSWVTSVAFSSDGKRLASGSWDKTVRLWDAEKGEQLGPMQGHTNWVTSIAFSSDGKSPAVRLHNNQLPSPFTLEPLHNQSRPIHHSDKNFPPPFSPFSCQSHWVTYLGSRILWLPLQYWDSDNMTIVLSGKTLLVAGGLISFFNISEVLQFCPLAP